MSDEIKENEKKVLADEELEQAAGGAILTDWHDPSGFLIVALTYHCGHFNANTMGKIVGNPSCATCTFLSVNSLAISICTHSANRKL